MSVISVRSTIALTGLLLASHAAKAYTRAYITNDTGQTAFALHVKLDKPAKPGTAGSGLLTRTFHNADVGQDGYTINFTTPLSSFGIMAEQIVSIGWQDMTPGASGAVISYWWTDADGKMVGSVHNGAPPGWGNNSGNSFMGGRSDAVPVLSASNGSGNRGASGSSPYGGGGYGGPYVPWVIGIGAAGGSPGGVSTSGSDSRDANSDGSGSNGVGSNGSGSNGVGSTGVGSGGSGSYGSDYGSSAGSSVSSDSAGSGGSGVGGDGPAGGVGALGTISTVEAISTPEPGGMMMVLGGLLTLGAVLWMRRRPQVR